MGFSINGWHIAGGKQSCEIKGLHQWLYCIITHSDLHEVWSKWDKRSCAQLYEVFISLRLPKKNGGINQFTFLTVCPIQGHLEAGAYPNHHSVRAGIKSGQPHIFTSVLNPLQHHLLQFPHSHSHGGYFEIFSWKSCLVALSTVWIRPEPQTCAKSKHQVLFKIDLTTD